MGNSYDFKLFQFLFLTKFQLTKVQHIKPLKCQKRVKHRYLECL